MFKYAITFISNKIKMITIKSQYDPYEVPRDILMKYPYFQSILEDSDVTEIELPDVDFQ